MTGAQPRKVAEQAGRRVQAFEVEIEVFWCDRLQRLAPGRRSEVWLSEAMVLRQNQRRASDVLIGHYDRACGLAEFREDCFWALDHGRQG